jgi:hypothetical protein
MGGRRSCARDGRASKIVSRAVTVGNEASEIASDAVVFGV